MKSKGLILAALILAAAAALLARPVSVGKSQTATGDLWRAVSESSIVPAGARAVVPKVYRTVRLNRTALNQVLSLAPLEFTPAARTTQTVLSVPMPDGALSRFRVEESPIMEPGLAAKAPGIKTYRGQGIDDPSATARFDVTPAGFHAIVFSATKDTVYVDPYSKGDTTNYISYFKRDLVPTQRYECKLGDLNLAPNPGAVPVSAEDSASSAAVPGIAGTLRTYRLALAVTGEYTLYYAPDLLEADASRKQKALAGLTTTLNRVNGIYEREVSVRMILVADQLNVIYTNPATDPYQSDMLTGIPMLFQNQINLDTPKPAGPIGEGNYDIGHVMSTGFGGVASVESVCDRGAANTPGDGTNAQGFTGLDTPEGDGFDVDFVAHEMGHQFGGLHTFNGSDGSCGGNETDGAMEPGSGSTIQAYAGICGTQDLQPHSDDYFHVRSLEEIGAFIRGNGINYQGNGDACSTKTVVNNAAPSVDAGPDYNVPKNTPFKLTAAGSDPDGDPLTYTWEEYDLGPASPAGGNDNDDDGSARPIFRSYKGTADPSRTFPSLKYVLDNANVPPGNYDCGRGAADPCITGEDLPSITRTMKFKVTARDNRAAGGGHAIDLAQVNVTAGAGPFKVNAPNTAATWAANSVQTVTWDVANTSAAPVGTTHVNILLSADGGQTFPYVLAANTANDGSEQVSVPNAPTSAARVKVEAVGNIFFDISDANFNVSFDETSCVTNHALAANGATAVASSVYSSGFPTSAAIDGSRAGLNWGAGGGWNDATRDVYPDWLQVNFAGAKSVNLVRVYTVQNDFSNPVEPTAATPAGLYGLLDFDVQYWDGDSWETVPGGAVRGNTLAARTVVFPALTTDKLRVLVLNSREHYARVTEVEAFGCP